ncbi:MAG: NAD(P)/FAD-dependent oxidoreductase [Hyphomicrobiaceae bacterium]|nr:NAD(P)/FAD-dependent oxidoreductase [Hyphomicrobiaceae bacterium]
MSRRPQGPIAPARACAQRTPRPKHHTRERLLVVGAGMAGFKLVEELTMLCPGGFDITMVGAEAHLPYNRVLLSSLLAGDVQAGDLQLRPQPWYCDNGIELLTGLECRRLDPLERRVTLAGGASLTYDRLVLATGSTAVRLPVPGRELAGVMTLRDLADVAALQRTRPGTAAVVIGGGLLGVEAAHGLASRGARVRLVHLMPRLMERQLDARSAALLAAAMRGKGIEVILEAQTAAVAGAGRAEHVRLRDGRLYPAELVVMAVGIRPATTLARTGGLQIGRGVKVDDGFATSVPNIYAIGECAEHRGACCGLVEPAYEQAKALARRLAGMPARYESGVMGAALKVSGIPVVSMGDFEGGGAEAILLEDERAALYRKLVVRDGRLAGAVLFGDTAEALWYRDLIRQQAPIAPIRSSLAFGRAYAEAA